MSFCNWCQMETNAGDVCAWCKRPMQARSMYGSFDYVREGEESSTRERMMPVIGGIAMLSFIVGLGYAISRLPEPAPPKKPETVAEFRIVPAPSSTPITYNASAPANSQGSIGRPFPTANRDAYSTLNPAGLSGTAKPTQAVASADRGLPSATIAISSGGFRIAKTHDGRFILYGEATVENTGADNIKGARFILTVEEEPIVLLVYTGEIHRPKYIQDPEIPPGGSTVMLICTDVSPKMLESGRRMLTIDGENGNGTLRGSVALD